MAKKPCAEYRCVFQSKRKAIPLRAVSEPLAPRPLISSEFPDVEITWKFCESLALTGFALQRMVKRFRGQPDSLLLGSPKNSGSV
jgi:hypothetical protein